MIRAEERVIAIAVGPVVALVFCMFIGGAVGFKSGSDSGSAVLAARALMGLSAVLLICLLVVIARDVKFADRGDLVSAIAGTALICSCVGGVLGTITGRPKLGFAFGAGYLACMGVALFLSLLVSMVVSALTGR